MTSDLPLPAGGVPIDIEALFATIGELYFQQRTYQRVIAQLQQQQHQAANEVEKSERPLNGLAEVSPSVNT